MILRICCILSRFSVLDNILLMVFCNFKLMVWVLLDLLILVFSRGLLLLDLVVVSLMVRFILKF